MEEIDLTGDAKAFSSPLRVILRKFIHLRSLLAQQFATLSRDVGSTLDSNENWVQLVNSAKVVGKGLLDNFCSACCTVGLRFVAPLWVTVLGFPLLSRFWIFSPKSLRAFASDRCARQALYSAALTSNRHDLRFLWFWRGLDPDINPLGPGLG